MARDQESDRQPRVLDEGWFTCPGCEQFTPTVIIQDLIRLREHVIPDVYWKCLECGEQYSIYHRGDYDSLLALYQSEARGIVHSFEPEVIATIPLLDDPPSGEEILRLCHEKHQQWCHLCPDAECGDNLNPSLGKGNYSGG